MVTSDVNSLYDNVNKSDSNEAFGYSTNELLPIGYMEEEMHDLWYKASDYMFDNAYFEHQGGIYRNENSQIGKVEKYGFTVLPYVIFSPFFICNE